VGVQGEVVDPNHEVGTHARMVTRDFFRAMGIKLLAGRDFSADDRQGTKPVAIVNEAFVRRLLGTRNPLATQFAMGLPQPDFHTLYTIVGVVQNVRYASLAGIPEPTCYIAEEQSPFLFLQQPVVVAARAGDPAALISSIQSELARFDPQIVLKFETAPEIVAATLTNQRLGMTLMVIFGTLALVLAAIGIYGIIAYSSAQRRTELATRIALGASAEQIFWLVMKSGQRLALIGIVIGVAGAYAGGQIVASNFYEMSASDPSVLLGATIIVGAVTFLATTIPAVSSSRLDPARALRAD
jgi:putative ABC transport system permease protein